MAAGHVRLGPGLIEEDEAARIKSTLRVLPLSPPVRDVRPLLLGGREAFFLKLIPSPVKKRDSMLVSTCTPRSATSRAASAASVMSGWAARAANTHARCGCIFEGRCPPVPPLSRAPLRWKRCSHLIAVAALTPNRRAAARRLRPSLAYGVNHAIPQILRIGSSHRLPPSAGLILLDRPSVPKSLR